MESTTWENLLYRNSDDDDTPAISKPSSSRDDSTDTALAVLRKRRQVTQGDHHEEQKKQRSKLTMSEEPPAAERNDDTFRSEEQEIATYWHDQWKRLDQRMNDIAPKNSTMAFHRGAAKADSLHIGVGSNSGDPWSILARLNVEKCTAELDGVDRRDVQELVHNIQVSLWMIGEHARRYNCDGVYLSERTLSSLAREIDERALHNPALQRDDYKRIRLSAAAEEAAVAAANAGEADGADENDVAPRQRLHELIGGLDKYVKTFLLCAAGRKIQLNGLKNGTFAIVNPLLRDHDHAEYLREVMRYMYYAERKDEYKVSGFYLISVEQSSPRSSNMRFPVYTDVGGHLQQLVREYIKSVMFPVLPADMHIFLNLSMRLKCPLFDVLRAERTDATAVGLQDPNGVLALVEIACVKCDPTKKIISVKAYIVSILSSSKDR